MLDKDESRAIIDVRESEGQFNTVISKQQITTNDSKEKISRHESKEKISRHESKEKISRHESKANISLNESKESIHDSKKRSGHLVSQSHVFETSEKSGYNCDLRDSNEQPFDLKLNAQSKRTLLRQYDSKNINSKFSFETHLTTKESSTSTLINKLRVNPDKNKSKKVGRAEMDSIMKVMSEILIKVSNNRMRLDTLEGNVELKIQTLINEFKDAAKAEINALQDGVKGDITRIHNRLGEFERLNFRLNKQILEKPYKYADQIKEEMIKEHTDIKLMINRKYEMLLTRIVDLKNLKEQEDEKTIASMHVSENDTKREIRIDIDHSRIFDIQADLESLREKVYSEYTELKDTLSQLKSRLEEYHEKIDYQIYEFKSQTLNDINNSIKEFQNFDRELKRYKDLFRAIQVHSDSLQNQSNKTVDVSNLKHSKKDLNILKANISPISRQQKALKRHNISKSMCNNQKAISISKEIEEEYSDFEEDVDKNQFPKILPSSRVHYNSVSRAQAEVSKTLQDIHQEQKKKLKLKFGVKPESLLGNHISTDPMTVKYISDKFKPIRNRGQSVTPMKIGLSSKIHVSLHNLF